MGVTAGVVVAEDDNVGAAQLLAVLGVPLRLLSGHRRSIRTTGSHNAKPPQIVSILFTLHDNDAATILDSRYDLGQAIQHGGQALAYLIPYPSTFAVGP